MKDILVGVDIGGTTSKIGLLKQTGEILEKWFIDTNKENNGASIVSDVWASIEEHLHSNHIPDSEVLGIGIGAPGFIDHEQGFVYEAVNIGWKNLPLAETMSELSGLPVFVENDANIAVLGENWLGAGENAQHLIAVTLGTGVGGGIIANGSILGGVNGMAGEIGHIRVVEEGLPCNCGKHGCLETIASATGISRQAMEKASNSPESALGKRYTKKGHLSAEDVFELAGQNDEDANEIVKYTMDTLGRVIANMGVIVNPEKVLIGGGVSKAGEPLIKALDESFRKYALPRVYEGCELRTAKLGNDAGIIGGAFVALNHSLK